MPVASASAKLEGCLDRYFETLFRLFPESAASAGKPEGEGRIGRATPDALARWHKFSESIRASLEPMNPLALGPEQQLDRLALLALLRRARFDYETQERHAIQPDHVETALGLLHEELLRHARQPERAATNLRALLRRIPGYLEEGLETVRRPVPVWTRVMQQTAAGAGPLLDAVEAALAKPHAAAACRLAIDLYTSKISSRKPSAEDRFAVGKAELRRRVRDQAGLPYSLEEIEAIALDETARLQADLTAQCRALGATSFEALMEQARAAWDPGPDLVEAYRRATREVRDAFARTGSVTFPQGDTLEVLPVPPFMRSLFPTAACRTPQPFDPEQRGIFWVNDLSTTQTSDAARRAERAQHFGLPLTAAHEGYPGHHLQFALANRHPRKWRRMFAHATLYEGWTLWCERLAVDLGVVTDPALLAQQTHDALWRAHRILIDLRLQTGRFSCANAVRHLVRHVGFTKARAQADVHWYTAAPTVPMSYWLGRLEVERLHRKLVQGRGWTLRKFNDWLLGSGTLPPAWIERLKLD